MFNVHVCMVSGQAAPNLLPLLDEAFKPKDVILLVTEAMREKAELLKNIIQPLGIHVQQLPFDATGNFTEMQEKLMALLIPYSPEKIALNATGGTKWMAIAAQEVFRMNGSPVFYMDIESGKILFLDKEQPALAISNKIKLKHYLQAYGYQITSEQQPKGLTEKQRELCQRLVANVGEWGGALGQLNRLANEAEHKAELVVALSVLDKTDNHLDELLRECKFSDILQYDATNRKVRFTSEETRFFANGGWLEEYINSRLNELKSKGVLQDSSYLNLKVASAKSSNEIDVAFMARNRLHLIECKTKRLTGQYAGSAGTESLYKLDSISDLGGLGTKAMLISYRPLGKADAQRAKDLNIRVVQGEEIQRITNALREWIG